MGEFKKVTLEDVNYNPKELSQYWRQYFSHLSVDLSRLVSKYTKRNTTVKFLHRDIFILKDYLAESSRNPVIQPFKLEPHGELGFVYIPSELSNFLIQLMLGGSEESDNIHYLTRLDNKLISHVLFDMITLIENHLLKRDRNLKLVPLQTVKLDLSAASLNGGSIVSVQQFIVMTGQTTFVFDIAFSNRFLESLVLI